MIQKKKQKTEPINFFITSTKIKQNNSNFVHSNLCLCMIILWSQFFMHRIYFISWKKEKAGIKFMNFSQKYMGSVFFWSPCTTGKYQKMLHVLHFFPWLLSLNTMIYLLTKISIQIYSKFLHQVSYHFIMEKITENHILKIRETDYQRQFTSLKSS